MVRWIPRITWAICAVALIASPVRAQYGQRYCQLLDRMEEPFWKAYTGYTTREKLPEGKAALIEAGGGTGLLYLRTNIGDFDLRAAIDSVFFLGSGGIDLPDQVTAARLDLAYVMRFNDGYALKLGLQPGVYSEFSGFKERDFFIPFSAQGILAINDSLSAMAGLQFYPEFDQLISPRAGLRWAITDFLLLDLFYPASRLAFRPTYDWTLFVGASQREALEYQLKKRDDRRALMLDETRYFIGVDRVLSDTTQWMFEAGRVVDREIDFRRVTGASDLEDAYYFRIGIGGMI